MDRQTVRSFDVDFDFWVAPQHSSHQLVQFKQLVGKQASRDPFFIVGHRGRLEIALNGVSPSELLFFLD